MIEITGKTAVTINAAEKETYKISYELNCALDILNNTTGYVLAGDENNFSLAEGAGSYLKLPSGACYNGYRPAASYNSVLYLYAEKAGDICVVIKGW